jgi:hypothetical protein
VPDQLRDLGAVLVGHREMFVKDVEVVHENSAQPGPKPIRWAQCLQAQRLVKRAAGAYSVVPITPSPFDVIARLDRAIQYSRPVFTGSPGQAGR